MYWVNRTEIEPEKVKKLPLGTEVHLEWTDRFGELTWIEGKVIQSGKKKKLAYYDGFRRETKDIKAYPNKKWTISSN